MKDGIVFLSSVTGVSIVPITFSCRNAWRPRGRWTDMTVPKPFSRGWILAGPPTLIPANLPRSDVAEYRELLQALMDEQQEFGDAIAGQMSGKPSRGFELGFYRSEDAVQKPWDSLGIELKSNSQPPLRIYEPSTSATESAA